MNVADFSQVFEDIDIDDEASSALGVLLEKIAEKNIKEIYLRHNQLFDGSQFKTNFEMMGTRLQVLDLSYNSLKEDAWEQIV